MRNKLIASLAIRLINEIPEDSSLDYLTEYKAADIINVAVPIVYLYTRKPKSGGKNVYLTEVIAAIGHSFRNKERLKRDSLTAVRTGAFILYSFQAVGLLEIALTKGKGKHAAYVVNVLNDDELVKLWENTPVSKTEKLPSLTPYEPWKAARHSTGISLIKTGNQEVINSVHPITHPIIFECVNRAQQVGWRVNKEVFSLVNWALRNRVDAFSEIWDMQSNEAKQSKLREARAILSIAKRFLDHTFYHLYYYDFRGRKYPATAYFHEQGSDLAKGLLLREDKLIIGEQGFFWLLISIANNWAGDAGREDGYKTDKIPLNDRVYWTLDNEEIIISYAVNPKVNQGWMKADKPWQFLAACMELMNLRIWQSIHKEAIEKGDMYQYAYESSLECYIDGSNNGSQHLSALTKDEVTAPHVNLVPLALPGDLYKYVADHVWNMLDDTLLQLTNDTVKACEEYIDTLTDIKNKIRTSPDKSTQRKELIEALLAFKSKNNTLVNNSAVVFWSRIRDMKHKRKVCKRNIMTLPYGGTPYGLG